MNRRGKAFWLAIGLAAGGLRFGGASAAEIIFVNSAQHGAAPSLVGRAGPHGGRVTAFASDPAPRPQVQATQGGEAIAPELPPDVGGPPTIAPQADGENARQSPRPPANSVGGAALATAPSGNGEPRDADRPAARSLNVHAAASAWNIEAAVEALLAEKTAGKPIGARDWRAARLMVGAFYLVRGFAPQWTDEGGFTAAGRAALAKINRAPDDGLDLADLAIPAGDLSQGTAAQLAQADVALSAAIVAYAVQASGGRIDPRSISPEITAKPEVADPFRALTRVAAASDADAALQAFNPPQKAYRDLREKLAEMRAETAPVAMKLPRGPWLRIGMVDARVPLIRARFGLDELDGSEGGDALRYDAKLAAAVASFQRANGLAASGVLNEGTVEALSSPSTARQQALVLANMEMWRWEPRDMGAQRVEVNVPDFTLKVTFDDQVVHRARVIVGKPDTQTAIFSNQIKYLLINPAWNVPMSIIKKEMLPKLVNDPDYLTRAGFEVTQKGDTLTVRQPPGERNALGHILFMFPNEHSIYLHDTPSRGLFGAARRAFSHGCVRVDEPMRLGELAMGGAERGWTQQRLRSLVGDKERTIFLPHPIAIHIEYFTAFVDDAGALQVRDDVYGHTRRVEAALMRKDGIETGAPRL